jgi:plasmid stabilization system protein ParE
MKTGQLKVVWTAVAPGDLERIAAYLANESPMRAATLIDRIMERAESLAIAAAPRRNCDPSATAVGVNCKSLRGESSTDGLMKSFKSMLFSTVVATLRTSSWSACSRAKGQDSRTDVHDSDRCVIEDRHVGFHPSRE